MHKEYRPSTTVQYEQYVYYNEITKWKDRMEKCCYKLGINNNNLISHAVSCSSSLYIYI